VVKRAAAKKPGMAGRVKGVRGALHHPTAEMAEKVGRPMPKIAHFGQVE
jgi:hypothetical protein